MKKTTTTATIQPIVSPRK